MMSKGSKKNGSNGKGKLIKLPPPDQRVLPHDNPAEMSVVGGVLAAGVVVFNRVAEILSPEDFYNPIHGTLWQSFIDLNSEKKPIDRLTVAQQLRANETFGCLKAVNGEAYFGELTSACVTIENIAWYAKAVRDKALQRRLLELGQEIAARGFADYGDVSEYLETAEKSVALISARRHDDRPRLLTAAQAVLVDWQLELPAPVPTGLAALDSKIGGGLLPESTYFLNAPTGRGKTGLVLQWVRNMARTRPVLYLPTELSRRQALARAAAQELNQHWIGIYRAAQASAPTIADVLRPLKLYIERLSIKDGIADVAARIADASGEAPVIVLDYLQHAARRLNPQDRRLAVAALSDEITRWATENQGVALIVSAVARPWTTTDDKVGRDFESSAKESGDVDYDATGIFFLETQPCPIGGCAPAKLHIAKHRFGGEGATIGLSFNGAIGTFDEDAAATLTDAGKEVLAAVAEGFTSASRIAEKLQKRKGTIQGTVNALIASGHLVRHHLELQLPVKEKAQ